MRPAQSPFNKFAHLVSSWTERPIAFILAFGIVVLWVVTGPLIGFSDTWQLVINTGTTIITFLMVFVIQNAQNRDTLALQLKLDELIKVTESANNALLDLEELDERFLNETRLQYEKLAEEARSEQS